MAAFRLRLWHELGDMATEHDVHDYLTLVQEAEEMRSKILVLLKREFPARRRNLSDESAERLAELLITALLGERFCIYNGNKPETFFPRAYEMVARLTNKKLLCYVLVLLFWLDEPKEGMRHHIDSLMSSWRDQDITPEDMHVRALYGAVCMTNL